MFDGTVIGFVSVLLNKTDKGGCNVTKPSSVTNHIVCNVVDLRDEAWYGILRTDERDETGVFKVNTVFVKNFGCNYNNFAIASAATRSLQVKKNLQNLFPVAWGSFCNRCYSKRIKRWDRTNLVSVCGTVDDSHNGSLNWRGRACSLAMSKFAAIAALASLCWRSIDRRWRGCRRGHGWGDNEGYRWIVAEKKGREMGVRSNG